MSEQESKKPAIVRVYTPESAVSHPFDLLRGLWVDIDAGRELAWQLFLRDLKAQYRQTYLGYIWAFLPPLAASLPFVFLQSRGIVNVEGLAVPYAAFALMGTLLWQTFVESMQSPVKALTAAKMMLPKINFPREAILMAGMYLVIFNFLIRMLLLVMVMLVSGIVPSTTLLGFPFAMFALLLLGLAVGLAFVPVGGLYNDVAQGIPILGQFWMLLTPVVYPARNDWLTWLNPVAPLISTARASLTAQPLTLLPQAILVAVLSVLVVIVGLISFRIVMPHLIARMGG